MIKIFSNNILSYLENDINAFIANTNCEIISLYYSTSVYESDLIYKCREYHPQKDHDHDRNIFYINITYDIK